LQDFKLPGDDVKLRQTPISKFTKPRLPTIYARTRLFRLLDRQRNVFIIRVNGPLSSGKTTRVASYRDSRKFPCLRYQVAEGGADISTSFYLGRRRKNAVPRKAHIPPLLTPEYLFYVSTFVLRGFFVFLMEHLRRAS
jgi:hypothetical protein